MQENWLYLNGKLLLASEAEISPYDHGFLYGHGLFETMRVYNGQVFCLAEHLARLALSSKVLGWPEWFDEQQLTNAIMQTLAKNELTEASIRLTVSRGVGACHPNPASCDEMTIVIFALPIHNLAREVYEQGWKVFTAKIRRNLTSPLATIKVANYLDNILAKAEVAVQGGNEALLLNTSGSIAEGTMSNIFFVRQKRLITPDLNSGILPGVTRATVLKLAKQSELIIEERAVYPVELSEITEVFITSSLLEIMSVTLLDGIMVGNGRPGAVTRSLQQKYQELVQGNFY